MKIPFKQPLLVKQLLKSTRGRRAEAGLPFVLQPSLDPSYKTKWQQQFVVPGRASSEGIWRRTQEPATQAQSGWQSAADARRRMIHFMDTYDIVEAEGGQVSFVIADVYLWLCTTLPNDELQRYWDRLRTALKNARWQRVGRDTFTKSGLTLTACWYDEHPEDVKHGRSFPHQYRTLEVELRSAGCQITPAAQRAPWDILATGVRQKQQRTSQPHYLTDLKELERFFPLQVELGGGASVELGIPPLNHLHHIYQVTNLADKTFVFGDKDSLLPSIVTNPAGFYQKASIAYQKSLLAQPDAFYLGLKSLFDQNKAVGKVITNNFDGLVSLIGLEEHFVRRYEDVHIVPKIDFDSRAKALLVIGNHADRRLVQQAARNRGLTVIYVDPEYYFGEDGQKVPYPLESLQAQDLLIPLEAGAFAQALHDSDLI